ncbi:50S ribosomal protein L5 [Candidatus Bathyarchaeota archaeon]|nr:50S ribosomal protein L5 [Candidatus Bathyarchaeota archaeon]
MRRPKIIKVVVHSCVGESGAPLEKAMKILEELTGAKPCIRKAKRTIKDFGIYRGEPISCMVTLRGSKAVEFLKKALAAVGNRIKASSFDKYGNFSFGIREHLDIPGTKYNPELGTIGMDVCVHIGRPGYNVDNIGKEHRITKEEAIRFMKEAFGVEVI